MIGLIIIIILVVIVAAVLLYVISAYNRLVSERLKVDNQWSQIDIVLKQRSESIPNLVNIVKGYAGHEKELLNAVTQARSRLESAANTEESIRAASDLDQAMGRFFAVAENYPDLKANANFMELQRKYYDVEEKIADFRQFYNDTVMRYNRLIQIFPSNIIAGLFHFEERSFFTVDETSKENVNISF